jgi:DNA repair protein SbcD/Mre11
MSPPGLRVLLLADTHIGLDLPVRPRVARRRRGPDFIANMGRALAPALAGRVDLVVHGGDLLNRSSPPVEVVRQAYEPLLRVARAGVPVLVVPGNHERSRLPFPLLLSHERVHVFAQPGSWAGELAGLQVEVVGLPFSRRFEGPALRATLAALDRPARADVRLLLVHQAIEGARVGVHDHVFRPGPQTLAGRDVPEGFAAVLSGHIHRRQLLRRDLRGRPLAAPVLYPGSVERTAFAERLETKGFVLARFEEGGTGGRLADSSFIDLPTRPMSVLEPPPGLDGRTLRRWVRGEVELLDPDAVVQVRPRPPLGVGALDAIAAPSLRELVPDTISITAIDPRRVRGGRRGARVRP